MNKTPGLSCRVDEERHPRHVNPLRTSLCAWTVVLPSTSLCLRGPWWSRNGRSNPRFHDCAGSAVCARGGGRTGFARQSPVRSRATKNPCHACAHQIVTPPRQRTPPATPTTRPQLRPCAHLACTSHGTSRQDQRCQIRDAITRCRASAPHLGRGTESPATLQSPLLRLRAPFNLRW